MGQTIDWRSPNFQNIFERYDRADFAQEFMRRSPVYRRQYAAALRAPRHGGALDRLARHWGLVFALDPHSSAAEAPALWRPQSCGLVTIATPAPAGFAAACLEDIAGAGLVVAESIGLDAWHLVIEADGHRFRLSVLQARSPGGYAWLSPADCDAANRLAIASVLHHLILSARKARPPACARPGATERWRLVQWLRLLDAGAAGASPRDLAAAILGDAVRSYSAADWDASSERRRIGRWQRHALAMRDGGFRALLGDR